MTRGKDEDEEEEVPEGSTSSQEGVRATELDADGGDDDNKDEIEGGDGNEDADKEEAEEAAGTDKADEGKEEEIDKSETEEQ